jgi:hypothetical protein
VVDAKSPFVRLAVLIVDVTLEFLLSDSLSDEILLEALMNATGSSIL